MKTIQVTKTDTIQKIPAEIRSLSGDEMVVLLKDFDTSKLSLQKIYKIDDETWESKDGLYVATITEEDLGGGEVLVRVPKK
jgi:hypothetical protein